MFPCSLKPLRGAYPRAVKTRKTKHEKHAVNRVFFFYTSSEKEVIGHFLKLFILFCILI